MLPTQSRVATLTVVSDNRPAVAGSPAASVDGLKTVWGFACVIQTPATTILFDTGGDGAALLGNLRALGFEPAAIDVLVLSHEHSDHTGGLEALLDAGATPTAFVPASFSASFRSSLAQRVPVTEVTGPTDVAPGVRTTGQMGESIIEQALVIDTDDGLVVVTGCAHPGIVEIVRRVAEAGDIALVMGGFHLKDAGRATSAEVAAALQELGVAHVAPTHCTGEDGIRAFEAAFGEGFVPVGLGSVVTVGR